MCSVGVMFYKQQEQTRKMARFWHLRKVNDQVYIFMNKNRAKDVDGKELGQVKTVESGINANQLKVIIWRISTITALLQVCNSILCFKFLLNNNLDFGVFGIHFQFRKIS